MHSNGVFLGWRLSNANNAWDLIGETADGLTRWSGLFTIESTSERKC